MLAGPTPARYSLARFTPARTKRTPRVPPSRSAVAAAAAESNASSHFIDSPVRPGRPSRRTRVPVPRPTLHLLVPLSERPQTRGCPLSELVQDARYAVRTLLRSPGFTSVAVLTLALGIGANSAIFSFVDGVLLKPLPYRDPQQIVLVWEKPPAGVRNVISTMNFLDWKQGNTRVRAHRGDERHVDDALGRRATGPAPRRARVSSYFEVYGVEAAFGRTFAPDEDELGKDHVIVLSHRLWSSQFGSDPALVGKTVTLDSEPYTVIGVLPEGSAFDRGSSQFWRPLAFKATERTRNFHWMTSVARLKAGVTLEQAQAQMNTIGARIAHDYPDSNKDWGVTRPALHGRARRRSAQTVAVGASERRRNVAAHRLRESRQPGARPWHVTRPRSCGARGARCRALAAGPSVPYRERRPVDRRWSGGPGAGLRDDDGPPGASAPLHAPA